MDENRVIQIVRNEMGKQNNTNTYNTLSIPRHVHNGVDSPLLFQSSILTYIGTIGYDGSVVLLPKGWTATHVATGEYEIVHNLGTNKYVFIPVPEDSLVNIVSPIVSPSGFVDPVTGKGLMDVLWYDNSNALADTTFSFVLVTVANKDYITPVYYGTSVV